MKKFQEMQMFSWKFEYVWMILAPLWLFWHCMGWFGLVWAARMGRNILHGLAWWTRGAIKTYNLRKSYSFWTKNLGAYWSLRATQKWCVIFLIWQWMENSLYILEQQALNTCCLFAKPVKVGKILKDSLDLIPSPSRIREHLNFLFLFLFSVQLI